MLLAVVPTDNSSSSIAGRCWVPALAPSPCPLCKTTGGRGGDNIWGGVCSDKAGVIRLEMWGGIVCGDRKGFIK